MGSRNPVLLGVVAGGAGILVLLLLTRSDGGAGFESTSGSPIATSQDQASESTRGQITPRLEQPEAVASTRADRVHEFSDPGPAPADPIADSSRQRDDSSRELLSLPEGSIPEMQAKWDAIHMALGELSMPILMQRFDDNLAEQVASEDTIIAPKIDQREICALRKVPGQAWYRTALPRDDYPELYELKDAEIRLGELIQETPVQESQAKRKD